MPAAVEENEEKPANPTHERSEQMWNALKRHITRERERKKQEREAEVEEERLRKEREAREQQNVMTLGETKEQIQRLEAKLAGLKEEKHQLFLLLKKVLNEDDNRRRQIAKETSEMVTTIQTLQPALVHQPLYIPQAVSRGAPVLQAGFKATVKRPRSPSPPPIVPVSLYHQSYAYKSMPTVQSTSYQSPQKDDSRRQEYVRAVLWNKTPQYTSSGPISLHHQQPQAPAGPPPPPPQTAQQQQQPGAFYSVPQQTASIYYGGLLAQPPSVAQQEAGTVRSSGGGPGSNLAAENSAATPRGGYVSQEVGQRQAYHLDAGPQHKAVTLEQHYAAALRAGSAPQPPPGTSGSSVVASSAQISHLLPPHAQQQASGSPVSVGPTKTQPAGSIVSYGPPSANSVTTVRGGATIYSTQGRVYAAPGPGDSYARD